jgi:hypothetical protein
MIFIDSEKVYDKILTNIMRWTLEKKLVLTKYITLLRICTQML